MCIIPPHRQILVAIIVLLILTLRSFIYNVVLTTVYSRGYENKFGYLRANLDGDETHRALSLRLAKLQDVVLSLSKQQRHHHRQQQQCKRSSSSNSNNSNSYLRMTGKQFGQTSNHLVSFIHGLGLATSLSEASNSTYTLLVPHYIALSLAPFNLTLLHSLYCFELLAEPKRSDRGRPPNWVWLHKHLYYFLGLHAMEQEQRHVAAVAAKGLLEQVSPTSLLHEQDEPPLSMGDVSVLTKDLFFWNDHHVVTSVDGVHRLDFYVNHSVADRISDYSRHFLIVLGALWSQPSMQLKQGVASVLRAKFMHNTNISYSSSSSIFDYSSAHKRDLDGSCDHDLKFYAKSYAIDFEDLLAPPSSSSSSSSSSPLASAIVTKKTTADTAESSEEKWIGAWGGIGEGGERGRHPICAMSPTLVSGLVTREGKGACCSRLFLASDRQTDDGEWLALLSSFSSPDEEETTTLAAKTKQSVVVGWHAYDELDLSMYLHGADTKYLDLMLAFLANGLFVGNPKSTLSFQVFVLRAALGLASLPHSKQDFYFMGKNEWVSQSSIASVMASLSSSST